ncbi:MAG: DUF502 domain-containing protein [Chloroflexota bacterium]|nr:DUF502 domain-containing protein [Chloroflexota bacterium]
MIGRILTGTVAHFRGKLLSGLVLLIPIVVTYLVLKLVFNFISGLLRPLVELKWFQFLPHISIPWVSVGLLVALLYVAGVIFATVLGSRMARWWNQQVERVPLIRFVYRTARLAAEMMSSGNSSSEKKFNRVVLLDYPRPGVKSIGLVTSKIKGTNGEPMLAVYIPTSPTPNSGYLAIVAEDQVTNIDMTVDESMRIILTAGIMAPEKLNVRPAQALSDQPPPPDGTTTG